MTIEGLSPVTRDTDPATTTIGAGPDGTGAATKTYVEGSLTWIKHDQDGALLAGATFEVCQTHVYVTTGATPDARRDRRRERRRRSDLPDGGRRRGR